MTAELSEPTVKRRAEAHASLRVAETDYADCRDFLFDEAALLDARDYQAWLALLAPEIAYRVTAGVVRYASDAPMEFLILDDRLVDITTRINQISNPKLTFAENPAPFIRRLISNVRVRRDATPDAFQVDSSLLMYRQDAAVAQPYLISGSRRDVIRRSASTLQLVKRHVRLDQSVIPSANLATFM
jgi:3-phenylpropionate/cinnamic acid dioxygenase small subunit